MKKTTVVTRRMNGSSRPGRLGAPQAAPVIDDLHDLLPRPARLHQFFEEQCDRAPHATALIAGEECLSYGQLEARANRLARYLLEAGAGPGRTVGILLERSIHTYTTLLAVLKTGSAFVPIDPSYPTDRVSFIASDASLALIVSTSDLLAAHADLPCRAVALDTAAAEIASKPEARLSFPATGDPLAYIIYTSGTTGRPKGVAVSHSSICHFIAVCTQIYGVTAADRVYQGMTISFDFSIEEIWPTFHAGATLLVGPNDSRRFGSDLAQYLVEQEATVLCAVPTLLATLDREIPSLRTLLVGGEACPRNLVERWSRAGRRMLNTYGPTETTVTASWGELEPGKAVTIGRPMPGYRIYILDENLRQVAPGQSGEIVIGGAGVARGYVNRPDLTDSRFVADPFLGAPGARMYRSGDLGRFLPNGEIEFLGRIDTQVKIRGYRIELAEIEAVILEDAAVANAAVVPAPGGQDLAAYITLRGEASDVRERLASQLRRRLPAYMVPGWIEILDAMPVLASGKTDAKRLPPPCSARLAACEGECVKPATQLEERLAAAWSSVFGGTEISVESDFFLDLGGHSLLAAQLVSHLREEPETRRLSIADLYANPTVRRLARHVASQDQEPSAAKASPSDALRHSSARVWTAGLAQLAMIYALLGAFAAPVITLFALHGVRGSWAEYHTLDLLVPPLLLLAHFCVPIVVKWTVIGRFRPGRHPLWGAYFCRWWLVRKALDFSPLPLLAGSPLAAVYLRLLGARIGRNCQIASPQLHLPDLIEIGDGASIGYEAEIQPFIVRDGWLEMDPVRIGADAFLGAKSVVLAGAEVGDGARVGEQSLVAAYQQIPAGESWAGSPSQRTAVIDPVLDAIDAKPAVDNRPGLHLWVGFVLAAILLDTLPFVMVTPGLLLLAEAYRMGGSFYALAATPVAGLVFVLTACMVVFLGKRITMPSMRPGIYPLHSGFGLRKWISDKLMTLSLTVTNTLYATLYTVPWLRALGARIGAWSEISTVSHIDPDLLRLGEQTFVADIASIGAATFHRGYVALGWTEVGSRTFIGNAAVVRSQTKLPGNCLIGVQSVAPLEPIEPGTNWLGSPAIFLPRRQVYEGFDEGLTYRPRPSLVAYRLAVELLRIVLPGTLLYLLGAVAALACFHIASISTAALIAGAPGAFLLGGAMVALIVAALKWMLVGRYRARIEPLWSPFVRHSELITGLYESAIVPALGWMLTGTPWLAPLLRLLGAHIGRRVYMESTFVTEFDLVHVADDASIGRASSLQTHLFEDRIMKMAEVRVGAGAAIGPRAVVLYGSSVGDAAGLDALSLVMKGESLPAATSWRGIPARLEN